MLAATAIAALWSSGCGSAQRASSPEPSSPGRAPAPEPRNAAVTAEATPGKATPGKATPGKATPGKSTRAPVRSARVSAAAPSDSATAAAVTVEPAPRATAAGPQILSVATSPGIVHGGEHAIWDVRTSPDVVSVTATVDAYTLTLVRRSAGRFGLDFAVPDNVPGVFHGTYNLQIVARSGTGATAARTVSVIFQ